MTLICYRPGGSLGMQNVRKWLDRHMVNLVAPTAHRGPRQPGNG